MGLSYKKNRNSEDSGSFWTSYSDLFLGMSVIFLLLYVTASLRQGTNGIQQQIQNQKLQMQVEDLQNQLKMYDSVRHDYLNKDAPKDDQKQYSELMDKLTLLKEEAKNERDRLKNEALQNERKEEALNQYQQMVRNIINANVLAKTKIKRREDVIGKQDVKIDEQATEITGLQSQIDIKKKQLEENEEKMAAANEKLKNNLKELKRAYTANKMTEEAYEKKVEALRSEASHKLKSLKEKAKNYEGQLAEMQGQLSNMEGELKQTKNEATGLKGKLEKTKSEMGAALAAKDVVLKEKEGQLEKARAEADARRQIAKEIKHGFSKVGVSADVNERTGEVIINFGDTYFDKDSAQLKESMKEVLKKAMPVYSKSLLGNKKVANKIAAVEIIGFASPTYKGKYVDPQGISSKDAKEAVNYNLDLSYGRARAIFQYAFDESQLSFDHQKDMLPLIKVTGRSFLAEKLPETRKPAGGREDFCHTHDCKKAQKVIIRFSFEDKK